MGWRRAARIALALMCLGSVLWTGLRAYDLVTSPTAGWFVERGLEDAGAGLDRLWLREATPERIARRIEERLSEDPRNWVALDALAEAAKADGIALPPVTRTALETADAEDRSFLAQTGRCAACAVNPDSCDISGALMCRVGMDLTPLGDIRDITRQSANHVRGLEVDEIELGLSTIGLGATVVAALTGGSSLTIKGGASVAKTARRVGALSGPMVDLIRRDAARLVDWSRLEGTSIHRFDDDLRAAIRPGPAARLGMLGASMQTIRESVGIVPALHLLRSVDDIPAARRMALAAEARPNRVVALAEVSGPARMLRATLRWSDEVLGLIFGAITLLTTLAGLLASIGLSVIQAWLRRRLRRVARD